MPRGNGKMSMGEFLILSNAKPTSTKHHYWNTNAVSKENPTTTETKSVPVTYDMNSVKDKVDDKTSVQEYKCKISYLNSQLQTVQTLICKFEDDNAKLQEQYSKVCNDEKKLRQDYNELMCKSKKNSAENVKMEHSYYQLQAELHTKEEKLTKTQRKYETLVQQYEVLHQDNIARIAYAGHLRTELERSRNIQRGVWQRQIEHSFELFDQASSEGRIHEKTANSFICPICMDNHSNVLLKCTNKLSMSAGHMICHECLVDYRRPIIAQQSHEHSDFDSDSDSDDEHPDGHSITDMNCPVCRRRVHDIIIMH
jgi:hypothetical protein